jgi:hypothetical protein
VRANMRASDLPDNVASASFLSQCAVATTMFTAWCRYPQRHIAYLLAASPALMRANTRHLSPVNLTVPHPG